MEKARVGPLTAEIIQSIKQGPQGQGLFNQAQQRYFQTLMQIKTTRLNIILGIAFRQVSSANSGLFPLLNTYNLSYVLKCSFFGIFNSVITGRISHMIMCQLCPQYHHLEFQGLSSDSGIFEFYLCYIKVKCLYFLWTPKALPGEQLIFNCMSIVFPCRSQFCVPLEIHISFENFANMITSYIQHNPSIYHVLGCTMTIHFSSTSQH